MSSNCPSAPPMSRWFLANARLATACSSSTLYRDLMRDYEPGVAIRLLALTVTGRRFLFPSCEYAEYLPPPSGRTPTSSRRRLPWREVANGPIFEGDLSTYFDVAGLLLAPLLAFPGPRAATLLSF